jgi:hypothetical protein
MKAIETTYKGCRFRSRLEARWAVFFGNLNLIWEYEKEGFYLENSEKYLPDFWLPELDCFFEVKGSLPTDDEKRKAHLLSAESKKLVVIASGSMNVEALIVGSQNYGEWFAKGFNMELFAGDTSDRWQTRVFDFSLWDWFFEVDLPPFIKQQFPNEEIGEEDTEQRRHIITELDRKYYWDKYHKEHPQYKWGRYEKSVYWVKNETNKYGFALEPDRELTEISNAYKAARSARFEFNK